MKRERAQKKWERQKKRREHKINERVFYFSLSRSLLFFWLSSFVSALSLFLRACSSRVCFLILFVLYSFFPLVLDSWRASSMCLCLLTVCGLAPFLWAPSVFRINMFWFVCVFPLPFFLFRDLALLRIEQLKQKTKSCQFWRRRRI